MKMKVGVIDPNDSSTMQVNIAFFNQAQMKFVVVESNNRKAMHEILLEVKRP